MKYEFNNGKYTVQEDNGTNFKALRYGEEWRDLTGDSLILSMLYDYDDLMTKYIELEFILKGLQK